MAATLQPPADTGAFQMNNAQHAAGAGGGDAGADEQFLPLAQITLRADVSVVFDLIRFLVDSRARRSAATQEEPLNTGAGIKQKSYDR